jgi:hypothetical protein
MQPQYLDGSSDNFGALSAKLVVRDIETCHLAIGRTESIVLFVSEESSILLPVIKGARGARGGAGRRGGCGGGKRGRERERVNIKRNAQRSDDMEEERSDAYEK